MSDKYEHLPMGTELFLADLDPYEDRSLRIVVMAPNQVMITVVRRVADLEWKEEGPQIMVSSHALASFLPALHLDDDHQNAEQNGHRMGYPRLTLDSPKAKGSREDTDA
jgi:hypothetical protein